MHTVDVQLGDRSYPILVGTELLKQLGTLAADRISPRRTAVISDETVAGLYGEAAIASLRDAGWDATLLTVPVGEGSKSLTQAGKLYDELARLGIERSCPLFALGGGVVGDLTGFVAATWLRGVPFFQVPTTLEADIDASVGGKTAVNHPMGKNLIGAFHQPLAVIIDVGCLDTLSDRDLSAGLAESVKHGVIRDASFFDWHESNADAILGRDAALLAELIAWNCRIKAAVVSEDEREKGLRAILNYGHTIGHAVEAEYGYDLRHGECVALGTVAANQIALSRNLLTNAQSDRITSLLQRLKLPTQLKQTTDTQVLVNWTQRDKKVIDGRINFVLADGIGRTTVANDVDDQAIADAIASIQS